MENYQRIKARLLRWFPAILKKYMIFGLVFFASVFRLFTHRTRYLVLSFNMKNDQRIKAHLLAWLLAILKKCMIFGLVFLASHQTKHLVSSFSMENDQRIKARLLRGFPAILKKQYDFWSRFLLQYFDCLPRKLDTWHGHSIWKMISASRRVF